MPVANTTVPVANTTVPVANTTVPVANTTVPPPPPAGPGPNVTVPDNSTASTNTTVSPTPAPVAPVLPPFEEIVKSKSDDRRYRRFRLANGLDCLMISDPTSTKSAAAMDINVGYWSDPETIPGLAHFLEHMLFLGTEKYPEEDSYTGYLSSHGGASNAYTSMQNTNYYFDIQPEALYGALDRFAQFFIAPLFSASATGREVSAVESEHMKNLNSDSWRQFQLIQSFANASHPFHKFGTGSSESLGAVPKDLLREALISFWKKHYTAKNMRVAVLGRENLDTLEQWTRIIFADLPVGSDPPPYYPIPHALSDGSKVVFPDKFLPAVVRVQSVKDVQQLLLLWVLPPQMAKYATKSLEYISTLLGSEAKGSLLSYLKKQGWVTSLSAGTDLSTGSFDLFQVEIELSKDGVNASVIPQIASLVFEYIRLIDTAGVEEWRWHEMGTISAIHFRLKNKEQAQSYVSSLAADMSKYAPRDVLMANFMYTKYDPTAIHALLAELTPKNVLVMLASQNATGLTQSEKWYNTKYSMGPVPTPLIDQWMQARFVTSNDTNATSVCRDLVCML